MSARLLAAAATLAFAASLVQADVWRWKDAQNKWHYSDVPIEGAELVRSGTRLPPPQPAPSASASAASGDVPPVDRVAAAGASASDRVAAEATARQVQQDIARKRGEQCKEATTRYERSITARRLFREGSNGERVYLTEAELTQARIDARTDRDTACGSPTR